MTLNNIARNAVRPSYLPEMARKVYLRLRYGAREAEAGRAWAEKHAIDLDEWAKGVDSHLWAEANAFANRMRDDVQPQLDELDRLGITMGGGGCYELLYFLVRLNRPEISLETGVAAGWSTRALLSAMQENERGHLYSSDFPYFRLADPEAYVGYLVPDGLKARWDLYVKGDRINLKQILSHGRSFDFIHYDSDKSRGGREFFARSINDHLSPRAVFMMDDIGDDLFFKSYVADGSFKVFEFEGKFIGLLGML